MKNFIRNIVTRRSKNLVVELNDDQLAKVLGLVLAQEGHLDKDKTFDVELVVSVNPIEIKATFIETTK